MSQAICMLDRDTTEICFPGRGCSAVGGGIKCSCSCFVSITSWCIKSDMLRMSHRTGWLSIVILDSVVPGHACPGQLQIQWNMAARSNRHNTWATAKDKHCHSLKIAKYLVMRLVNTETSLGQTAQKIIFKILLIHISRWHASFPIYSYVSRQSKYPQLLAGLTQGYLPIPV